MLDPVGEIDCLAGTQHPIELIHVAVDGIHQNLARKNLVLDGGGRRVLRQCRAAQDAEQSNQRRQAAGLAGAARFGT